MTKNQLNIDKHVAKSIKDEVIEDANLEKAHTLDRSCLGADKQLGSQAAKVNIPLNKNKKRVKFLWRLRCLSRSSS